MFAPAIPLFLAGGLLLLLWIPATMLSKIAKETDLSPVADGLFSWGIIIIMSSLFVSVAAYALMHFSEQAERKTPGFVNDSNLLFRPFLDWRSWFRRGPNWIDRIIERISAMLRRDKSGRDGPVTDVPVAPASSDDL
jgi:predicted PurR-regulated permease PerM